MTQDLVALGADSFIMLPQQHFDSLFAKVGYLSDEFKAWPVPATGLLSFLATTRKVLLQPGALQMICWLAACRTWLIY